VSEGDGVVVADWGERSDGKFAEPKADAAERFRYGAAFVRSRSFGHGGGPNPDDRAKMMELLQLRPEQSTDAFVLHRPEAKYFNV
jgi:cobalamin-dependent methionine synthase I